jgi:hypothetical protein
MLREKISMSSRILLLISLVAEIVNSAIPGAGIFG